MEDELGIQVKCPRSCIIKGWVVVKPRCEKCGRKSKCLYVTHTYSGLRRLIKTSKKISGLKIISDIEHKRHSN
jgi:hypothetical protein